MHRCLGFDKNRVKIEGSGAVDEWFKSHAWKACVGLNPPRVRIPPAPPVINEKRALGRVFLWVILWVSHQPFRVTIFMADVTNAETSVILLGTMSVVVASDATLL